MICKRCGKKGHLARSCRTLVQHLEQTSESSIEQVCYSCGEIGHFKRNCPKAATTNNVNNAKMVLAMKQEKAATDPTVVGIFLLDNSYVRILFESSVKKVLLVIHSNIFVNIVLVY